MNSTSQPLVSIGLPVYNGEEYLRKALSALVAQDYSNFELIISDNNSQDGTEAICREFASSDSRIRTIRQSENRGAAWNFNLVLEQARGGYFMWAAHDDMWEPTYITKCLKTLESHPEAVVCCTEINFIDSEGNPSPHYAGWQNLDTSGMTPVQRIHALIARMGWFAIYGLMRPEAIRKVASLKTGGFGVDVVVLLELMLMGQIAKVPEPLLYYRIVKAKTAADHQEAFNSERNPLAPPAFPYCGLAARLLQTVYGSSLSRGEKTAVFADFLRTISIPEVGWRPEMIRELFGKDVAMSDAGFAFLLGQILGRGVPLDEIKSNPLMQAVYCPPRVVPDLLGLARGLLNQQTPQPSNERSEKHQHGQFLFGEGKFEEASQMFGEALLERETSDCWVDWATAQLACDRTAEAECGLERALQLDARNALAALKLGLLMTKLGRAESALPYLERSLPGLSGQQRGDVLELIGSCRQRIASLQPAGV